MNRRRRRWLALLLAVSGVASGSSRSVAQPATEAPDRARARQLYVDGSRAFERREFDAAVRDFEAAWAIDPRPALLLNIAQAHRLQQPPQCAEALRHYEMFLAAVPRAPERPEIEAYAADMRRCVAENEHARATAGQPSRDALVLPARQTPVGHADSKVPLWITVAGGVIAATGGTLWIAARSKHDALAPTCPCDPATIDRWQTITRIGYGLTAGGLALATGGIVWWLRGRPRASSGTELTAALSPREGWVAIKGAF